MDMFPTGVSGAQTEIEYRRESIAEGIRKSRRSGHGRHHYGWHRRDGRAAEARD
jgi:hypothetical protein